MSRLPAIATASTLIVVASVGLTRPALAQPTPAQGPFYAFCWTPTTKQIVYLSAPFQTTEPSTAKVGDAFSTIIKKQYGYSANDAQCSGDLTAKARDAKLAAVQKQAQNGEVTTVTFAYTPAAAPPVVASSTPAPAPAVAGSASLDPGNLKNPWLQKAKDELKSSKGYCETNILLRRILDCDCFARQVFQFRVAHAAEYKESNREEGTGWVGYSNILMAQDFVCTGCLDATRVSQYVHQKMLENSTPAISMGRTTAAKVNARADCVAPKYLAEFKAHPHVFEEQGNWNRASEKCLSP